MDLAVKWYGVLSLNKNFPVELKVSDAQSCSEQKTSGRMKIVMSLADKVAIFIGSTCNHTPSKRSAFSHEI